jgi:hypothetical protein
MDFTVLHNMITVDISCHLVVTAVLIHSFSPFFAAPLFSNTPYSLPPPSTSILLPGTHEWAEYGLMGLAFDGE